MTGPAPAFSPGSGPGLVHALSFDVEDWFHLMGVPTLEDRDRWPVFPSIVEERTGHILSILREHGARATFFFLGWTAERHPALVRRVVEEGHEVATHSYWHRPVPELGPEGFRKDLSKAIGDLERVSGVRPRGFRAPSFSIVPGTEWAFDVLLDLGIEYDSSLFPGRRAHGGYPCRGGPHWVATPGGRRIMELPISVARYGAVRLCYAGGGYLRLLPLGLIEHGMRKEAEAGRPTVVYLHPRDFAPDCPRVPMPLHRRFKSYVGLATTERKLRRLLAAHRFDTCEAVLRRHLGGA